MAIGMALLGAAVSVIAWAARLALAPDGGAVLPAPLFGTGGENYGSSGLKATRKRTRAALVVSTIVFLALVVILGAVQACAPP